MGLIGVAEQMNTRMHSDFGLANRLDEILGLVQPTALRVLVGNDTEQHVLP